MIRTRDLIVKRDFIKNYRFLRCYLLSLIVFCLTITVYAQSGRRIYRIKYISNENVYLDAGSEKGLAVGDKLAVVKNKKLAAELVIVYLAKHSASCKIEKKRSAISTGDQVVLIKQKQTEVSKPEQPSSSIQKESLRTTRTTPKRNVPQRKTKRAKTRISGSVSLQHYQLVDHSSMNLDFEQPTIRLRLRARHLWGKAYNLNIRSRSRYYTRSTSYRTIQREAWRNRIYEVSFDYSNEAALVNYKLGRIISNKFSGVGYIDGAQIQFNATDKLKTGIFAGTQPQWQYSSFQSSMEKYGGYLNYTNGDYGKNRIESTLAAAGEYHNGVVSREFLYLQNSFSGYSRWHFFHSMELDINRDWRKELTRKSVSLSSLYLSFRINLSRRISTTLSYDNRTNYYSYMTRSLADSLFDDAMRQGLRSNLSLKLSKSARLYANVGVRKKESDNAATVSYYCGFNKSNFLLRQMYLNVRISGFSNLYSKGFNPSIRLGKSFRYGHSLYLSYGNYMYALDISNEKRMNQWIR
ncbi:MAG: hypothetical protein DWQ10_08270, partial [Calditrichaeota bacterium]